MNMYKESIKRPFKNIKKTLIGGLLSVAAGLPFVSLFFGPYVRGYIIESAKGTLDGRESLADWGNPKDEEGSWSYGDKWRFGLGSSIIGLLYAVPAIALAITFSSKLVGFANSNIANYQDAQGSLFELLNFFASSEVGILSIVIGILFLLAMFVQPVAVLSWAQTGKFKNAFDYKKIAKKAFTGKFFLAWLFGVVIFIATHILVSASGLANISEGIAQGLSNGSAAAHLVKFIAIFVVSAYIQFIYQLIMYTLYAKAIK